MTQILWPFIFGITACASVPSKELSSRASDGFKVNFTEFQSAKKKGVSRTVLIFPPTGGVTYLEKSYARALAKRGATVKVIKNWSKLKNSGIELTLHQKLHERAMRALEMVYKTVPAGQKISLMGTSLGGIYAAVATHRFDFMDRVFVVAAGNPVPQIIAKSEHNSMTPLREKRFAKFGFANKEAYAVAIDEVFTLDPSDNPDNRKGKTIGMAVLLQDEAVPTTFQKNLQDLWQPEKVISISAGHFWGILRTWISYKNQIADFLVPSSSTQE